MNRLGGIGATLRRSRPQSALRWSAWTALASPAMSHAQVGATAVSVPLPLLLAIALAIAGVLVALLVAMRSVRIQRELTAQLREARARSASLEPLLDAWVWQTDARHRLVSIRPRHGAAADEWSGVSLPMPLAERFVPADPSALQAMLAGAAALDDIEVQLTSAGTPPRRGLLRGRALADASGGFAGYLGTFHERGPQVAEPAPVPGPIAAAVSESVASQPSAAQAAATPAGDHESFSFTVSHDLRAPIRVVEGFTKIIKEDYGRLLDRVGNDHLDRVLGAAARMNNMIDALLALSKLSSQPLARQPVNLSRLAGYVADDLRRQWPDRVVNLEIEPDLQVQGDPTLLRVVIENLLGNAWKYTGKVPQGSVRFGRHAQDADTFTVHDNGAGFDMRFADRLFGVFQRLHSANDFPGTGVGLASVRRIVRRHGGEIWGEAEVNSGARFHFSLPQG